DVLARYRAEAAAPGAMTAMLNYYRANLGLAGLAVGPGVAVPTLLLWGERDAALGPELVAPTADYVGGLTVRRFPEASHWLPEEAPDAVNAGVADWLSRHRLRPA